MEKEELEKKKEHQECIKYLLRYKATGQSEIELYEQAIAHLQRELKQPFLSSGTKQNLQSEIQWRETAINDNKRAIIKYQEEINERQSAFRLLNVVSSSDESDEVQEFFRGIQEHIKRSGSIDRLLAHLVFVGLPGSGKSTLIARLLKLPEIEKLLKASPSTGVMNGIIAVDVVDDTASMHAANIGNNGDWNTVEFSISCLRQMGVKCFVSFEDNEGVSDHVGPSDSSMKYNNSKGSSQQTSTTLAYIRKILKKEGKFESIRPFLDNKISLYLSDTGGQIEFQELLPLLVAGLAIFVFLFPLNVKLSDFFRICYRKEDGSEDNCYTSSLTIREALLQTLSSIDAMRTDSSIAKHKPYVFIAGTHKDCLMKEVHQLVAVQDKATLEDKVSIEAVDKRIAEIDNEIKSLIKEHKYDDLVVYADPDKEQAIFAIDNTCESEIFGTIRSRILQFIRSREEFRIRFPLSYLLASLELQDSRQPFLSRKDFTKTVSHYGISEVEVDHLLQFLHSRIGQIRYFPTKGLKDVIVKEPQALFDLVTDLIINSFKQGGTMADHLEVQRGIYSFEDFHFESHFSHLTPTEVIELLKELRIVAPFMDQQAEVEKYFIPCVLNHLSESTLEEKQTDIQSLALMFECGHCPKGTFGVLIHYILTHKEEGKISWNLDINKIFKDQVSFQFGIYEDIITFKFLTTHLEVRCYPNSIAERSEAFSKKIICNRVRVVLHEGIKQATKDLHYDKRKTKYSLGLVCEKCMKVHEVMEVDNQHILKCPKGYYNLPDSELYWFGLNPPIYSLPCEVRVKEGSDEDIQWMVSCKPPLKNHSRHSLSRVDSQSLRQDNIFIQGSKICLRKVKKKDAGKYVISSSNAIGYGHASFDLQVLCSPEYTLESDFIEASAGTSPTVQFSVDCCPPLDEGVQHILTKEGSGAATKRFRVEDNFTKEGSGAATKRFRVENGNTIIFHRVIMGDSGTYQISCENDIGKGYTTLELVVNASNTTTSDPQTPKIADQHDSSQAFDLPTNPLQSPTTSTFPLKESCQEKGAISRRDVRIALQGITKEWDDLAEALGLSEPDIDAIKTDNPSDVKQCVKEVVDRWFKGKGSEPPSWASLCAALRDPLVNRKDIASSIEKVHIYCPYN